MPLELIVPYAEKDKVKSLGGLWMPEGKTWVAPDDITDINPFRPWIPYHDGCLVRKPYLLCLSKTNCWKCGKETLMIALGAKNYYAFDERSLVKMYQPTLFNCVKTMSPPIKDWLHQHYPSFKMMYSHTLKFSYYANTCTACGRLQGDFFHHEEPGGAFFPEPFPDKPLTVSFQNIDLKLDYHIMAEHGSMAYEDLFFPERRAQYAKQGIRVHILKS